MASLNESPKMVVSKGAITWNSIIYGVGKKF
jgi:hypothetical protein